MTLLQPTALPKRGPRRVKLHGTLVGHRSSRPRPKDPARPASLRFDRASVGHCSAQSKLEEKKEVAKGFPVLLVRSLEDR